MDFARLDRVRGSVDVRRESKWSKIIRIRKGDKNLHDSNNSAKWQMSKLVEMLGRAGLLEPKCLEVLAS
jgi:hypothetical protein